VLGVVRSHYPRVDLKRLDTGMSSNTDRRKAKQLRTTCMEAASKMIVDVDLFGDTGQTSQ
jgi:hypothetical protein